MASLIDVTERRKFDYRVLHDMQDARFSFTAYATRRDFDEQRNAVRQPERASKFRCRLVVPTLSGPGTFVPATVIGIDTEIADYPVREPRVWLVSTPAPWSPHFRSESGTPVCTGTEFWEPRRGHVTLGHLVNHLQRLLNWDEKGRGSGYAGWNPDAIAYHRRHYGAGPLDPDLRYSPLPAWLTAGETPSPSFQIIGNVAAAGDFFTRLR